MAITPDQPGVSARSRAASAPLPAVDADAAYLEKLGYKQELKRSLGLFSAFGVQFTSIAIASGLFTTLVVGLGFFGPASFWSFVVGGALQVFTVGLAVAEEDRLAAAEVADRTTAEHLQARHPEPGILLQAQRVAAIHPNCRP